MKIAVCLYGEPRYLPYGPESLKFILGSEQFDSLDFFIHAWFDESRIGMGWDTSLPWNNGLMGTVQKNADSFILDFFKPKGHIIEKYRTQEFLWANEVRSHETVRQDAILSQFYSQYISNNLKLEYEREYGFKYDLVLRSRLDLLYQHFRPLETYLESAALGILVPATYQNTHPNMPAMVENCNIATSEHMDILCGVYPNFKSIQVRAKFPFTPNYQYVQVNDHGINIVKEDFHYATIHSLIHAALNFQKPKKEYTLLI